MPYDFSTFTLPCGAGAVRANASGDIGKEDVLYFMERVDNGKPYFGMPLVVTTDNMKSLSTEARGLFANTVKPSLDMGWCAMVVNNPMIRVSINFMMRLNRHPKLRVFGKEGDAVRWLDERMREDAATRAT